MLLTKVETSAGQAKHLFELMRTKLGGLFAIDAFSFDETMRAKAGWIALPAVQVGQIVLLTHKLVKVARNAQELELVMLAVLGLLHSWSCAVPDMNPGCHFRIVGGV